MGRIVINDRDEVTIPRSVKMKEHEVAELLGIYPRSLRANVKAIIKAGLRQEVNFRGGVVEGNLIIPSYYSLKFIIAIAFRINTPKANILQNYILSRSSAKDKSIYIQLNQSTSKELN